MIEDHDVSLAVLMRDDSVHTIEDGLDLHERSRRLHPHDDHLLIRLAGKQRTQGLVGYRRIPPGYRSWSVEYLAEPGAQLCRAAVALARVPFSNSA